MRAASFVTTLNGLKYQGEEPGAYLDRVERLVEEYAFFSGSEVKDESLCTWFLASVKDNSSLMHWSRERSRVPQQWYDLRNEFSTIQGDSKPTSPPVQVASAAVLIPADRSTTSHPKFSISVVGKETSISEGEIHAALLAAGFFVCNKCKRVGAHKSENCRVVKSPPPSPTPPQQQERHQPQEAPHVTRSKSAKSNPSKEKGYSANSGSIESVEQDGDDGLGMSELAEELGFEAPKE